MSEIASIKDQFITEMWLSTTLEAGRIFRPHLRKNKKMKVLTLTNDKNFREVMELTKNRITKKELIFGWNKTRSIALRLDCEGKIGTVLPGAVYEDSICGDSHEIIEEFPFDIVNLDFSSQNPREVKHRIEKEINSVERTVKLQIKTGSTGMAFIYTTLLDSNALSANLIKQTSDGIIVDGWAGIMINGMPSTISEKEEKIRYLNLLIGQVIKKYGYEIIDSMKALVKNLSYGSGAIFSTAVLLRRV